GLFFGWWHAKHCLTASVACTWDLRPPRTEPSLTRMHMRLNKRIYALRSPPKARAILQVSIEPAEAFHAAVHSVRRCGRGEAALRFAATSWCRYKWTYLKEAYGSEGFLNRGD